jgi:large subunit ribosomal protein L30
MGKNSSSSVKGSKGDKKKMLRIRLVRSLIGVPEKHRRVVRALGLRKRNSCVVQKECPEIIGMIFKVQHLLEVERVEK